MYSACTNRKERTPEPGIEMCSRGPCAILRPLPIRTRMVEDWMAVPALEPVPLNEATDTPGRSNPALWFNREVNSYAAI